MTRSKNNRNNFISDHHFYLLSHTFKTHECDKRTYQFSNYDASTKYPPPYKSNFLDQSSKLTIFRLEFRMSNVRKQNPRNFLEVLRSKAGNTAVESADEPSLFLLPEARDSSTVTLIRAADSRNARHPRFLLLPLLSSLSRAGDDSPRSGFRALALRGTTCSSAGSS